MDSKYPSIFVEELATKARAILREFRLRMLPVVDEHKLLLGTVSRNDVMTISSSVSVVRVRGIMSKVRFVAPTDMDAIEASKEMMQLDEWYAPVARSAQDNEYMGVFGLEHALKRLYEKGQAKLNRPISDFMTTKNLLLCSPNDEADDVWQKMKKRGFAACPVMSRGKPIGMLSEQDLLESGANFPRLESAKPKSKKSAPILTLMTTPIVSLKSKDKLGKAIQLMLQRNIGRIAVTDDKGLMIGIVDREDVLKALTK